MARLIVGQDGAFQYRSTLNRRSFYGEHSNAMLISAKQRTIGWKIFRTKKNRQVRTGSFTV